MSLHQQTKTNRELRNAAIFASVLIIITTALPVGRLAREMTPVGPPFEAPCHICMSLTDEQLQKIQNRKRYLKKQKAETSSKDELDLLGEGDGDSFTGSNADLESAADNLFTSPPPPHPLSSTSRLQFFIFKDPSQSCPTHPRYCFAKQNSKKYREIPG